MNRRIAFFLVSLMLIKVRQKSICLSVFGFNAYFVFVLFDVSGFLTGDEYSVKVYIESKKLLFSQNILLKLVWKRST